jgi:hypothetical protein
LDYTSTENAMNPDNTEHLDTTDLLIKAAIIACFIVFGICMWLVKRERDKRKNAGGGNVASPKISKN